MKDGLMHMLWNVIFVSIPEETFLVCFILVLQKKFDYLNFSNKIMFSKFAVAILIPAILSNILKYFGIEGNNVLLFFIPTLIISMLIIYKANTIRKLLDSVVSTLIAVFVWMTIEFMYMPIVINLISATVVEINSSVFLNFLLTIPERLLEILIIAYFLKRKFNAFKIDIIRTISKSRAMTIFSLILLSINIFIIGLGGKFIIFDRCLVSLDIGKQLFFIIETLIIPIFNMVIIYVIVYNMKYKEIAEKVVKRDNINTVIAIVDSSLNEGKYKEASAALEDIKTII
ncbi:hypothetical protein DFR58_12940 [Anaerobacterium chartisolvens]|uniref:Uncharacterized protein n=1 Tax=Anaerobacterium chartisolvens TaxID=1297424 RepID=A0A369AQ31_9FIRM|nr:hypothetical protein [Anaerobacterium chartisolvens]RCX10448.1 hypothetical protein DFR58_12940 [Anaerobacterium chartisolvens]